jgi:hypothetical protein
MDVLIMDSPVDFDVWCSIEDGSQKLAATWTANLNSLHIIESFKIVRNSMKIDGCIQIFMRCGLDDIPGLLLKLPDFVQKHTFIITQSSYRPSDCPRYCEIHSLRYVTQLCPVCNGFYISNVANGKRFIASKIEIERRLIERGSLGLGST